MFAPETWEEAMIPFMVDPNWYWLYWYEPHRRTSARWWPMTTWYAWHTSERDSGRFTGWFAEWKQSPGHP